METQIENLYSRIQNLADSHRNGKPVTEKLKGLLWIFFTIGVARSQSNPITILSLFQIFLIYN